MTRVAGGIGNLVSRVTAMIHRYRDGVAPGAAGAAAPIPQGVRDRVDAALARHDFRRACEAVWAIVDAGNRHLERVRPWELARSGRDADLDAALAGLLQACRTLATELAPFLPGAAAAVADRCAPGAGRPAAGPAAAVPPAGHRRGVSTMRFGTLSTADHVPKVMIGRGCWVGRARLGRVERTQSQTVTGPPASPRTAVVWAALTAEVERQGGRELAVVDVGGGTGGFAVPLAQAGHRVTVVDPSPDALAALTRRAADAGVEDRIAAVQGDGDRLAEVVPAGEADLVLCHSLLEVVDDPAGVLRAVATVLRPGGAASVLVANLAAAVLVRAMGGHLDAAAAVLDDADATDPLRRRFDAATASAMLTGAGLVLEQIHGVRVLADLVPAAVAEADPATLLALETRLSGRPPYRDIAAQLHLFARRAER